LGEEVFGREKSERTVVRGDEDGEYVVLYTAAKERELWKPWPSEFDRSVRGGRSCGSNTGTGLRHLMYCDTHRSSPQHQNWT